MNSRVAPRRARFGIFSIAVIAWCWTGGAAAVPAMAAGAPEVDVGSRGGVPCSDVRTPLDLLVPRPWCTIDPAVAATPPGGTVVVRAGSYPRVTLYAIRPASRITVQAHPGEQPIVGGLSLIDTSNIEVRGMRLVDSVLVSRSSHLRLTSNDVSSPGVAPISSFGVALDHVTNSVLRGNRFGGAGGGIAVGSGSSGLGIVGNHFSSLGDDSVRILPGTYGVAVTGNVFEGAGDPGSLTRSAISVLGPSYNLAVTANIVRGGAGFSFGGDDHHRVTIVNNALTGHGHGIRLAGAPRARIVNNTVWGATGQRRYGVHIRSSGRLVVANNILQRMQFGDGARAKVNRGNLVPKASSPKARFVDEAQGDLRLRDGSPGIDSAAPALAPPVDVLQQTRKGLPDIGAFDGGGTVLPRMSDSDSSNVAPTLPKLHTVALAPAIIAERNKDTPLQQLDGAGTVGPRGGATLAWRASTPGLAVIRVDRRGRGRRTVGSVATIVRATRLGDMATGLTARIGGRRLRNGRYVLRLWLLDAVGRISQPRTVTFRVSEDMPSRDSGDGGGHPPASVPSPQRPIATPVPTPIPPPEQNVLFEDRFDGPRGAPADPAKWVLRGRVCDPFTNHSCPRDDNVFLDGRGRLVLRVKREPTRWLNGGPFSGAFVGTFAYGKGWPPRPVRASWPVPYRIEMRALMPNAPGLWPAAWDMNVDRHRAEGIWELDWAEQRMSFPTTALCGQHLWINGQDARRWTGRVPTSHMGLNWHVYSAEVRRDTVIYRVDDVVCGAGPGVAGRFGLLLDNIVGAPGSWGAGGGQPALTDPGPWDLLVDYVRVTSG